MQYDEDTSPDDGEAAIDEGGPPIDERLSLRSSRVVGGYSPQARQRIEYLQELRRLRSQIGDDAIDTF
jgi:hypothetical protein